MIIILEGPDGSGKTTLAKKLVSQTGFKYIHKSYPKTQEEMDNMTQDYLDLINTGDNMIIDRSWYSEIVYGPILRSRSNVSQEQALMLEQAVATRGGLIILALWIISGTVAELEVKNLLKTTILLKKYANVITGYLLMGYISSQLYNMKFLGKQERTTMKNYLDLGNKIITEGEHMTTRTGATRSLTGESLSFNLAASYQT
jgi:predicted ATPase